MKLNGSLGRQGRRLMLAPATAASLRPKPTLNSEVGARSSEQKCAEGRAVLSRLVAMVAEASLRPKKSHSVPIKSKFWSQGDESEDSEDEEPASPSTPDFVSRAMEAGFTADQLLRAEHALSSGNKSPQSEDVFLSKLILDKLISKKNQLDPWRGPLPKPRISPPRTLGDVLAAALPTASMGTPLRSSSRGSSSSFRWSLPVEQQVVGSVSSRPEMADRDEVCLNSKFFESPDLKDLDPNFLRLLRLELWGKTGGGLILEKQSSLPLIMSPDRIPCPTVTVRT